MKVVNPLNKTPLSSETMVNFGCHCVCSSGSEEAKAGTWNPFDGSGSCSCSCGGGEDSANYNANFMLAKNA